MKLLCIVGSQLRHQYFLKRICENFDVCGIINQKRTLVQPSKTNRTVFNKEDLLFEKKHLEHLKTSEENYFSEAIGFKAKEIPILEVDNFQELNSEKTVNWVKALNCDAAIDYGSFILKDAIMDVLPYWSINLHGGLSPWYKGSAALLWPLVLQQPELLGITYHLLSRKIDGGKIIQHFRPEIKPDDSPHDLGCRSIKDGAQTGIALLKKLESTGELKLIDQKGTGKLFLEKDYKPSIIQTVYHNINNGMLENYLNNKSLIDSQYQFIDQL